MSRLLVLIDLKKKRKYNFAINADGIKKYVTENGNRFPRLILSTTINCKVLLPAVEVVVVETFDEQFEDTSMDEVGGANADNCLMVEDLAR